jgi:excisionase family DNA binding protein
MYLTLGQVARELGMNKPTLSRYIKSGKISAERQEDGSYRIDPSEMDRLRSLRKEPVPVEPSATGEVTVLRELLAEKDRTMAEKDRTIANLMQERDEWREQCKKQLLLLTAPKEEPRKKRWWRW